MSPLRERTLPYQARLYHRLLPYYARGIPSEPDVEVGVERHGEGGAAYAVCPDGLDADSVVYSFGIGADISFDLSLIERYGLTVHGFDPTDASAGFIAGAHLPKSFHFHQWALADRDGPVSLQLAQASSHLYQPGSLLRLRTAVGDAKVEGYTLDTVVRRLGHDTVDVLKLDVEGAEYGLIERFDPASLPARQVVLELHPHLVNLERNSVMIGRRGWRRTQQAIERLRAGGYRLFDISERRTEFSFLRT